MARKGDTIKTITVNQNLYERMKVYCKANNISVKGLTEIILTEILGKLENKEIEFTKETRLIYKSRKKVPHEP